ncbi:hypothetical protein N9537_04990 [Porticoccaceae bacterium]|nr:hypothetical protein [Porticoccaceae bacterium]
MMSRYLGLNILIGFLCTVGYLSLLLAGHGYLVAFLAIFLCGNFFIFSHCLNRHDFSKSLLDIGFILLSFFLLYTITPILLYLTGAYGLTNLGWLELNDTKVAHLTCLHIGYAISIQVVYLVFHPKGEMPKSLHIQGNPNIVLIFCGVLYLSLVFIMIYLSGPIETYYDFYTRFDHYSGLERKFISLLVRIYNGLIPFLLLFTIYKLKSKSLTMLATVLVLCGLDIYFSHGSRIQALFVIIQAMVIYSVIVRPIPLRNILLSLGTIVVAFTAIEIFRIASGDLSEALDTGMAVSGEFNALFYPSLHLFDLRHTGGLPEIPWALYFKDVIELFPLVGIAGSDPMHWYWQNFHPDAQVAPYTLGPISDSAMFGGELSVLVRGVLMGSVLVIIRRAFFKVKSWIGLSMYAYLCSIVVLALKYGFLTPFSLVLKNWFVGFVVVLLMVGLTSRRLAVK